MKFVFHLQQSCGLTTVDAGQRNTGHFGDGIGDDVIVDDSTGFIRLLLPAGELFFLLLFQSAGLVTEIGRMLEILLSDSSFFLPVQLPDLFFEFLQIGRTGRLLESYHWIQLHRSHR